MAVLTQKINAGETISDAFTSAGFSPFECHLVAAGERSAQLETVFDHLTEFWKRQQHMSQALRTPLYYPIIVLHLTIVVASLVDLMQVSPHVAVIHFFLRLAALYLAGFVLYTVVRATWSSPLGQRFWLFVPIIGKALSSAYSYRWITVMRIEFSAGISMPNAVADAWRASGFVGSERLAREGEKILREGTELSKLMQKWTRLPRDWIDFIETGEVSGALETAFINLEAEAARTWTQTQQRMAEWVPKIVYFFILLIIGWQIIGLFEHAVLDPISHAEDVIDKASGN